MSAPDALLFAWRSVSRYGLRSALIVLAMAVGVAAIVTLTALGEGARRYVTGEIQSLGSNLLIVLPGRNETTGGAPPLLGETPRDLTLDDARAIQRLGGVSSVAPVVVGTAHLSHAAREREVLVLGSTASFARVREISAARGRFLPEMPYDEGSAVVVIGESVRRELFGTRRAIGEWVRVGDRRLRVIGVLATRGTSLGTDLDEVAIIPVASAQALFDAPSLFRILIRARSQEGLADLKYRVGRLLRARHDGEEDVTLITQDALLSTFDTIFDALTLFVGAIGAISIVVAGVLIMNVSYIAVAQRTAEIGLLKALGATAGDVRRLILTEAACLALGGALAGLLGGQLLVWIGAWWSDGLPLTVPAWAFAVALLVPLGASLVFAALPAGRAARLDPVAALARR